MIACGWWCFADTEAKAHPFKGRLQSGARLGDERERVLKSFGTPTRKRVISEEQAFETFSFAENGIVLSFKSGKLAHVMIVPPKKTAAGEDAAVALTAESPSARRRPAEVRRRGCCAGLGSPALVRVNVGDGASCARQC